MISDVLVTVLAIAAFLLIAPRLDWKGDDDK